MRPSTGALAAVTLGCALAALFANIAIAFSGHDLTAFGLFINLACATSALALVFRVMPEAVSKPTQGEDPE